MSPNNWTATACNFAVKELRIERKQIIVRRKVVAANMIEYCLTTVKQVQCPTISLAYFIGYGYPYISISLVDVLCLQAQNFCRRTNQAIEKKVQNDLFVF